MLVIICTIAYILRTVIKWSLKIKNKIKAYTSMLYTSKAGQNS